MKASSSIARSYKQDVPDAVSQTVMHALRADTTTNEWAGGHGGKDPPTVERDFKTRVPIDVDAGEEYREGVIERANASFELFARKTHIVVSVWNRESIAAIPGFQGQLQIAILYVTTLPHLRVNDGEATLTGLLRHVEDVLEDHRHQNLCENQYGGDALVKRLVGFELNSVDDILVDKKKSVFSKYQQLVNYEVSKQEWSNPPPFIP